MVQRIQRTMKEGTHLANGLDMNDKVDSDKITVGNDSDEIEGEKSGTIQLNLERECKDLELTKKQNSKSEIDNGIIKSVPEETASSQGQDSNKTGTKLTTTLDPQTNGIQNKEENSVELRKESDTSNEQKNDVNVASLTRSVPPLSESALNLPVLPPAFIKMVLHPDQSIVSTNSKDSLAYLDCRSRTRIRTPNPVVTSYCTEPLPFQEPGLRFRF